MTIEKGHPVFKAILVLRGWLCLIIVSITWNAFFSNGILLHGWARPIPFFLVVGMSLIWFLNVWSSSSVILAACTIAVGTGLRGLEVLLFAEQYDLKSRATGASLWITVSGTAIAFGIVNLVALSRKNAEDWVWSS